MSQLLIHTLPAVVGAGVVSRATDTMFGKGKRGTARKKSAAKTTGTKGWHPANWFPTKTAAERDAGYFRKAGHEVKVVKTYDKYFKKWGYKTYVR